MLKAKINVGKSLVTFFLTNGKTWSEVFEGRATLNEDNEVYIEEPHARIDNELAEYTSIWTEFEGHTIVIPTAQIVYASVCNPEPFVVELTVPDTTTYYWDKGCLEKLTEEELTEHVSVEAIPAAEYRSDDAPDFPAAPPLPKDNDNSLAWTWCALAVATLGALIYAILTKL